ncbi:MAG: SDR family NAD(P)-dependent oxidoreductase [Candidatus Dadabacteria bacterium]
MNQLMGRTAIVTGGTGALGRAVTFELLTRGANVMCTYLKDEELDASFALRQSFGDRVVFGKADVARQPHVAKLVSKTEETFSRIDILVNVVGGFTMGPIGATGEDDWDAMMDMNLKSAFLCSKAVIPVMIMNEWGRIINVGARPALKGSSRMSAYGASKAGVLNLTQSMAEELREHGITVNAVIPGTMDTPGNRAGMPDADYSKWVPTSDVAKVVAFLSSEEARSVSGAFVPVFGKS